MYNLDLEKKIILILAVPLGMLSLFLLAFGQGVFVSDAAEDTTLNSETIYEQRLCADCSCRDAGKKLISFKGQDANCEDIANEEERRLCYNRNSQMAFSCENLESTGEVADCYAQHSGPNFDYYHGEAGTLVATQSVSLNGSRLYLNGFDCRGEHKIMTGTTGKSSEAMTFREGSRDVEYGGNLDVYGNVNLLSAQGGVYFGSELGYEVDDLGNGQMGRKLTTYDTSNGINMNKCDDMKLMANGDNAILFPNKKRSSPVAAEIQSGLEMNGPLKTIHLYIGGQKMLWSKPIRGNYVMYAGGGPSVGENHTFLWKPHSDIDYNPEYGDYNAVILLPAYYPEKCLVLAGDDIATFQRRYDDGRPIMRLAKPGWAYGENVEVQIDCAGDKVYFEIPDGGERFEYTAHLGGTGCSEGDYIRDGGGNYDHYNPDSVFGPNMAALELCPNIVADSCTLGDGTPLLYSGIDPDVNDEPRQAWRFDRSTQSGDITIVCDGRGIRVDSEEYSVGECGS